MIKRIIISVLLSLVLFAQADSQVTFVVDMLPQNTPAEDNLYIAGSFNGWDPGSAEYMMHRNGQDKWEITLSARPAGTVIQFKFTRGSWETVEKGAEGEELPNRTFTYGNGDTVHVDILSWADNGGGGGSTASDNVTVIDEFFMPQLNRSRRIWIYLPPDYNTSGGDYPVLYMHDGQNLFDGQTSFAGEWQVDETLNSLALQGYKVPVVVGIDNGGIYRIGEYTPWSNQQYGGGDGELYIRFIAETLKPYIDEHFRTIPGRENTAIMGSSLGGLISLFGSLRYQDVFSKAGIFSPSYWFSDSVYRFVRQTGKQQPMKLYQLCGTAEGGNTVGDMLSMNDTLLEAGFQSTELYNKVVSGGQHNEAFWRSEFGEAYLWLFGNYAAGSESIQLNHALLCFPNPVSEELAFQGFTTRQIDSVSIYNLKGQVIMIAGKLNENKVDVKDLDPGIYLVRIRCGNAEMEGRFIKM